LETVDIRSFARDKHATVDDAPYGGGPGMVLRSDVLAAAVDSVLTRVERRVPVVFLSPRGAHLNQRRAREFAAGSGAVLICGRFEGVDERVLEARGVEEVSVGDYVLSGGEPAALTLLDAVVRLLPGVMHAPESPIEESFEAGLLEHPQYTRPRVWEDRPVPEVLVSGDHGEIRRWRRAESERITRERRPDLWAAYSAREERTKGSMR
jgi:tRNA (guanine37-N1)-methyltransferase